MLSTRGGGGQTVKCLVTKQCLMMFGSQTFPVWTGLYTSVSGCGCDFGFEQK